MFKAEREEQYKKRVAEVQTAVTKVTRDTTAMLLTEQHKQRGQLEKAHGGRRRADYQPADVHRCQEARSLVVLGGARRSCQAGQVMHRM